MQPFQIGLSLRGWALTRVPAAPRGVPLSERSAVCVSIRLAKDISVAEDIFQTPVFISRDT